MSNVNYYIKIIKVGDKTTFHIQQGKSETDIAQQPEEGYPTKEAARLAKARMIRQKVNFTFRKELRKK